MGGEVLLGVTECSQEGGNVRGLDGQGGVGRLREGEGRRKGEREGGKEGRKEGGVSDK